VKLEIETMEDLVQTAKQTISKSEQKIEEIAKQNI